MTPQQIENVFSYHAPHGTQVERYEQIRQVARQFAHLIRHATPASREQSLALTNLQQAVMWANAAIAINEAQPGYLPALSTSEVVPAPPEEVRAHLDKVLNTLKSTPLIPSYEEAKANSEGIFESLDEIDRILKEE